MLGITLDDFLRLTPDEFAEACRTQGAHEEAREQGEWERTRTLMCFTVQPHTKKQLDPRKVLPLPWDKKNKGTGDQLPTRAEAKRRFEQLTKGTENG